jgi:hypothetical protein
VTSSRRARGAYKGFPHEKNKAYSSVHPPQITQLQTLLLSSMCNKDLSSKHAYSGFLQNVLRF